MIRDKNDNFLLRETLCSVIDVLYEERISRDTDIHLKIKIIPNDVNENYLKFKILMFNLLDGFIGSGSIPLGDHKSLFINETGSSRRIEIEMKLNFKDPTS